MRGKPFVVPKECLECPYFVHLPGFGMCTSLKGFLKPGEGFFVEKALNEKTQINPIEIQIMNVDRVYSKLVPEHFLAHRIHLSGTPVYILTEHWNQWFAKEWEQWVAEQKEKNQA
jgi:hypothetical protein